MPVAEWDSYIVQWRYLIQYLIGHIDTDADLIAHRLRMTRGNRCDTSGSDQVFIIKNGTNPTTEHVPVPG